MAENKINDEMNHLRAEVIKKSCAFVMEIGDPIDTLRRLSAFFQDRGIAIESLQMHRNQDATANLIIHCQIEKDRIVRTVQLLSEMSGVYELERMEGK